MQLAARGNKSRPNFLCPNCGNKFPGFFSTTSSTLEYEEYCDECIRIRIKKKQLVLKTGVDARDNLVNSIFLSTKAKVSFVLILLLLIVFAYCIFFQLRTSNKTVTSLVDVKKLKKNFPSQKGETWHHVLSVLETDHPTVKTITFLHGEDKRTTECLVRHLVSLFSKVENVKKEDVTFSDLQGKYKDYGEVLEYYRPIVRKFKVLVTDLGKVDGNIARVFHSLCDESSDVKPSLFIFTLRYDWKTEKLKPVQRTTTVLKEAWSDLEENEIFPLLSRIVKNVVEIVPERDNHCTLLHFL